MTHEALGQEARLARVCGDCGFRHAEILSHSGQPVIGVAQIDPLRTDLRRAVGALCEIRNKLAPLLNGEPCMYDAEDVHEIAANALTALGAIS